MIVLMQELNKIKHDF